MLRTLLLITLVFLLAPGALAQPASAAAPVDSAAFHPERFWPMTGLVAVGNVAVMYGLHTLWYSDYERTSFHWINDNAGWLQQDKIGHGVTAYHVARAFTLYGRWSGLEPHWAAAWGGGISWIFQAQIEFLDGTAKQWGASPGDLLANTIGTALGTAQGAWPETLGFYTFRFSYDFGSPGYDPNLGPTGSWLKDYDGQSYWLVVRPEQLLPERAAEAWPDWLALSLGHSGDGLCSARSTPECPHQRRLFLSLDFDLQNVDWPYRWMNVAAEIFSFVRVPAPALEFHPDARWHWLFY